MLRASALCSGAFSASFLASRWLHRVRFLGACIAAATTLWGKRHGLRSEACCVACESALPLVCFLSHGQGRRQIPVQHKPWQQAAGKGAQAAAAVVVDGGFTPVEVFCEGEEGEAGGGREGQGEGEGAAGGGAPDAAKRESGAAEGAGGRPMYTGWVGLGKGGVEGGSSEGRDEA
eukprot:677020-Rhodomonas_salina.1